MVEARAILRNSTFHVPPLKNKQPVLANMQSSFFPCKRLLGAK
jgi:hypothetical protein